MEKAPLDPVTALARVRNGAAPPTWTLVIPTPPTPAALRQSRVTIGLLIAATVIYVVVQLAQSGGNVGATFPCLLVLGLLILIATSALHSTRALPGSVLILAPEGVVVGNYQSGQVRRFVDFTRLRTLTLASETSPNDEDGPETALRLIQIDGRTSFWKVEESFDRARTTNAILAAYARYRAEHEAPTVWSSSWPAPVSAQSPIWASATPSLDASAILHRVATGGAPSTWRIIPGRAQSSEAIRFAMIVVLVAFFFATMLLPAIACGALGVSSANGSDRAGQLVFVGITLVVLGLSVWGVVALGQRMRRKRQDVLAQVLVLLPEGFVAGYPATGAVLACAWYRDLASISVEPGDATYALTLARREGTSTVWNLTRTFGNRDAVIQEIMMAHARQTVAERNQPRD